MDRLTKKDSYYIYKAYWNPEPMVHLCGKLGPEQPMWAMMQNFNLETLMGMMGSTPESAVKALNKQLNAFDLVD